jgi:hypothetical protein
MICLRVQGCPFISSIGIFHPLKNDPEYIFKKRIPYTKIMCFEDIIKSEFFLRGAGYSTRPKHLNYDAISNMPRPYTKQCNGVNTPSRFGRGIKTYLHRINRMYLFMPQPPQ